MKDSKHILAKCMAEENILVLQGHYETASFDTDGRVLRMPRWENMSEELVNMLLAHEVGHALYTPNDGWKEILEKHSRFKSAFNIVEDVRIERMMIDRLMGLKMDFVKGYQDILNRDFFMIKNKKLENLCFLDRLNIKAKCRDLIEVPFSDDEMVFYNRALTTETWDDVVELTLAIIKTDMGIEVKEESESVDVDGLDEILDGLESLLDNLVDRKMPEENNLEGQATDEGFKGHSDEDGPGYAPPVTADAIEANLRQPTDYGKKCIYAEAWVEEDFDVENLVIPYEEIMYDKATVNLTAPKKKIINNYVSNLIKEFELRKAAERMARARVSQRGSLDTTKLHEYRYNDNIFKQVTTIADGKNHGMVMIIDFSASMSRVIKEVRFQTAILAAFCKRANIPFRVLGFTSGWSKNRDNSSDYTKLIPRVKFQGVKVFEILRHDLSTEEFNEGLAYLMSGRSYVMMNGTPLAETVLVGARICDNMKTKLGLDKTTLVMLTDGAGSGMGIIGQDVNGIYVSNKFVRLYDRYVPYDGSGSSFLKEMVRVGHNTINFHITPSIMGYSDYRYVENVDAKIGENKGGYQKRLVLSSSMFGMARRTSAQKEHEEYMASLRDELENVEMSFEENQKRNNQQRLIARQLMDIFA